MERGRYLQLASMTAVNMNEVNNDKLKVHQCFLVEYDGIKYLPWEYVMGFDKNGAAVNKAVLMSRQAQSVITVPLEKVKES